MLTRPEHASRRFLRDLRAAAGEEWPAVVSPLMRTRFFDVPIPGCSDIVFTSETSVDAVVRLSGDRSAVAWCVGPRTEVAAMAAGYLTRLGPGTAKGLAEAIIRTRPSGPVFCPVAKDRAYDTETELKRAGIETFGACLYAQEPCPPSDAAKALLAASNPVILPLFSRRSVRLAQAAFATRRAPLLIAAISAQVATDAGALRPDRVAIARAADAEAVIATIFSLADGPKSG